ncbi:MAG TPA: flagellar protein FlaG [Rhodocyclaceae bacterium]|nr:flagellar protein FlaG [Rhodocyclaceae bacterium]
MAIQGVSPFVATTPATQVPANPVRATTNASTNEQPSDAATDGTPLVSVSAEATREALDRAMEALDPLARNLQFSIDDATGRTVVKIVDAKTKEVIRQIPSEEILALTSSMSKLSGLFIKQKV